MPLYKFRVLFESNDDVFRDIAIKSTQNFHDFHEIIVAAFGFDNSQMASFYASNEDWEKGEEITLFDMQINDKSEEKPLVMSDTIIDTQANTLHDHLLYVYDFFNMQNFFIELIEITDKEDSKSFYPKVVYSQGEVPQQKEDLAALSQEEETNELLKSNGFGEEEEEDDIFEGFDDFDDYQ